MLFLLLPACAHAGGDAPHATTSADLDALRAAFQEDAGQVRLVQLLSPS